MLTDSVDKVNVCRYQISRCRAYEVFFRSGFTDALDKRLGACLAIDHYRHSLRSFCDKVGKRLLPTDTGTLINKLHVDAIIFFDSHAYREVCAIDGELDAVGCRFSLRRTVRFTGVPRLLVNKRRSGSSCKLLRRQPYAQALLRELQIVHLLAYLA